MKSLAQLALYAALLTGCGPSEPAPAPRTLTIIEFAGFHVPGDRSTAKADGFTDCREDYSDYLCSTGKPVQILGLAADSAYVELNAADAFADKSYFPSSTKAVDSDPNKLSYRAIVFTMPDVRYDAACLKNYMGPSDLIEPERCLIPGGSNALRKKLRDSGWHETSGHHAWDFYIQDQPLRISIKSGKPEVIVQRLSTNEAQERWAQIVADESRKATSATKSNAFIEAMKKP